MAEFTIEQQRAIAIANARLRLQDSTENPSAEDTSPVTAPRLSLRKPSSLFPEVSDAERMAGQPLTRFALGAASPFFAAGRGVDAARQALGLPEWLKPELARAVENIRPLVQKGREGRGDSGVDVPLTIGEALNPAALAIGQGLPYAKVFGEGGRGIRAVGQNVASGGAMGLTTGGTSENMDSAERAGIGAAANVVIPPAISLAGKTAGWVWDNLVGRWGAVKASQIVKDAAGGDILAIRAATAAGAPGETATQATANIKNDVWDALGEMAKRNDKTSGYSRMLANQEANRVDSMRQMAGGATQTEARQARDASKAALNKLTNPMMETELGVANIAGRLQPGLQAQTEQLASGAASKVSDVRRLETAKSIADNVAQSGRGTLAADSAPIGMPRLAGKYSYGDELANLAERLSQQSADDSLILGEGSRFAKMQLDSLAQHGMRPLDSGFIIRSLKAKIADPRIGSEIMKEKVLNTVVDRVEKWTNSGGVMDAYAAYGIRKSAVNDTIEQLMGGADPKSKAKAAAGLLTEIKPLIDDAIVNAGGTKWPAYLKTFENGMRQIDQKKMAAKGLELLQKKPQQFESLVGGNEPKMVEKVFKTEYDIERAMGQNKFKILRKIADELERDRSVIEGAARADVGLARILDKETLKIRLPAFFSREATVTNKLLDQFERNLSKNTMDKIVEGMRTGKSARELLDVVPASEKLKLFNALAAPAVTGSASAKQ